MNEAYNIDCMEFMRRVPSKYFDLAVVDPPYGIEKGFKATSRVRRYGQTKTANDDTRIKRLRICQTTQTKWGLTWTAL